MRTMPTFQSDSAALLWNSTAVSNAFLCEYMPSAPDGYVKVYLYGLMYAAGGMQEEEGVLDDVAKALEMEREEVERALRYWERCRLVSRVQDRPPLYRFHSAQQVLLMKQSVPQDREYEKFAKALCDLFGNRRQLHGGETVLAYEWVEQQKLPPEVAIMLTRHMISTRGVKFSFKEAQKLVNELCEQNARTPEAAEAVFSRSEAAWKGAKKILNRFNARREPTVDEMNLYMKWTTEWGYAPKAVEAACAETTAGLKPSFAYLDGILKGVRERSGGKAVTEAQVEKLLKTEEDDAGKIRAMLAAFGASATVVDEGMRSLYHSMQALASEEVILLAAREVGRKRGGQHSIENVLLMLEAWNEKGISTAAEATAYLRAVRETDKKLRALFALAGQDASCTQTNRELLRKWRADWHVSDPLLELAATYAKNSRDPMQYMDRLLTDWREKDISTLAEAEEEHRRFTEAAAAEKSRGGATVKRVVEQQYSQREYEPEQFGGMSRADIEEAKKL